MWRYDGATYFPGVPGRDLTDDEYKELSKRYPDFIGSKSYTHEDDDKHPRIASKIGAVTQGEKNQALGIESDTPMVIRPTDAEPVSLASVQGQGMASDPTKGITPGALTSAAIVGSVPVSDSTTTGAETTNDAENAPSS